MKLNEMCETFAFDNHTYALTRDSNVEFPSLLNVYDALVDHLVVEKLHKFCSTGRWCLNNLTQEDIRFTFDVIRQQGRSLCSLAKCHHRLWAQVTTCPKFLPQVKNLLNSQPERRACSFGFAEFERSNSENDADVLRPSPRTNDVEFERVHPTCCSSSSPALCVLAENRSEFVAIEFADPLVFHHRRAIEQ